MDIERIKIDIFIAELQRVVREKEIKRIWKEWKEYKENKYGYETDCECL